MLIQESHCVNTRVTVLKNDCSQKNSNGSLMGMELKSTVHHADSYTTMLLIHPATHYDLSQITNVLKQLLDLLYVVLRLSINDNV